MRFLKFLAFTLVVALGFSSCNPKDKHDHSSDLAGTWTCLTADFAEAMVINEDGSVVSTILVEGNYLENMAGNIVVENDNVTLSFEDGTKVEGHFDIIPGMAFSIENENVGRMTFNYCEEDLSEEIIGMWVCTQTTAFDDVMSVNTYQSDGKALFTGYTPDVNGYMPNLESTYKVIGDLLIQKYYLNEDEAQYLTFRLKYSPNATEMGDVLTITSIMAHEGQVVESYASLLRVKQNLDLPGMKYDYMKTYVSNVKGLDQDIEFMGYTFNFATMDGSGLDMMLKAILFNVEFPDANTLSYSYRYNNNTETFSANIVVEDNKMTIKMSEKIPTLKDVVLYAFQDADCSQMHFYMHKTAFVNFYTNMQAMLLAGTDEQFDITDAEAVNAIYNNINNAVESINLSLVMTKAN